MTEGRRLFPIEGSSSSGSPDTKRSKAKAVFLACLPLLLHSECVHHNDAANDAGADAGAEVAGASGVPLADAGAGAGGDGAGAGGGVVVVVIVLMIIVVVIMVSSFDDISTKFLCPYNMD